MGHLTGAGILRLETATADGLPTWRGERSVELALEPQNPENSLFFSRRAFLPLRSRSKQFPVLLNIFPVRLGDRFRLAASATSFLLIKQALFARSSILGVPHVARTCREHCPIAWTVWAPSGQSVLSLICGRCLMSAPPDPEKQNRRSSDRLPFIPSPPLTRNAALMCFSPRSF